MKPTKAQQLMIDDGLPPSLIIDQSERDKFWRDNPPRAYSAPYLEKKIVMTQEQINLLFELKASKERGAASLGCSSHLPEIAELEKLGYAQQHGFGPTAFYITDAGLSELKKHKQPKPKSYESDSVATTDKIGIKKYEPKVKTPSKPKAVDPNLSAICKACGVSSTNRVAALNFLFAKIGKQQPAAAVIKAVYGNDASKTAAIGRVLDGIDVGIEKQKAKYEIKRIKDAKGVYSYGLYAK